MIFREIFFLFLNLSRKEGKDMLKIVSTKPTFLVTVGSVGGIFVRLLGGWGEDLKTLLIFMGIDFLLGLSIAAIWKKSEKSEAGTLNSWSAWKGLMRKGASLAVVLIGNRLDIMLGLNYIRTAVIIAFCTDELISIVENLGIMGVPLPMVIKKAIDVLKEKSEGE